MSKYTTEVRFICETAAGYSESQGYNLENQIISAAAPKIFNFAFPIFDESYRHTLECKILKHYYVMEIGCETVGLWKHFLDMKMNEIMPYYNQLYESALLKFNPFYDVDYTRSGNKISDGTKKANGEMHGSSSGETSGTDKRTDRYSDTPQGSLQNIENNTYLTNARVDDGSSRTENISENHTDSENNEQIHNMDEYIDKVSGKMGTASYMSLLKEFRDSFLNIDMMIINDLASLFMLIW